MDELFYDLECDKIDFKPTNNNQGNVRGNEMSQNANR